MRLLARRLKPTTTNLRLITVSLWEKSLETTTSISMTLHYTSTPTAPERNDYIAKINPSLENGSGMSNEDADRVIKQAEADGTASAMEEGARLVYKMLGENRERMQEAGLVDDDTIDGWNARYQFYVPLKGFASSLDDNAELTSVRGLPKGIQYIR